MRKLILLGLLASPALLLPGETLPITPEHESVTVQQLEQRLAADMGTHHKDLDPTHQIDGNTELLHQLDEDVAEAPRIAKLELTERLTALRLNRILTKYEFGPESARALQLLADRSALMDPPASELPPTPAPDAETQKRILEQARRYVFQVLLHLPNFFAIRTTAHYDNDVHGLTGFGWVTKSGLQLTETTHHEITFREGKEITDPSLVQASAPATSTPAKKGSGMESWGEFGPELVVILTDTEKGSMAFHHWERTSSGLAAVYRYSVPESSSHYEENYSCRAKKPFHSNPSYHGTLSIDPASGAVLRVTLETDSGKNDPIAHVSSVIEYGPVMIGDRRFVCPLRSLTFMDEMPNACTRRDRKHKLLQPVTMFNRTSFNQYHRLGSSFRLIPDKSDQGSSAALADAETSAPAAAVTPATSAPDTPAPVALAPVVAANAPAETNVPATAANTETEPSAASATAPGTVPAPALSFSSAPAPPQGAASPAPAAQPVYKGILPKPSSPYSINLE